MLLLSPLTVLAVLLASAMAAQHVLDHAANVYLTVTVAPATPALASPAQALAVHPAVSYVGPVGALPDVVLLSVPRARWDDVREGVLSAVKGVQGVRRVDVEDPPRMRAKRGIDEL